MTIITRRRVLTSGLAGSGLLLSGCSKIFHADALTDSESFQRVLAAAQGWTRATQRLLLAGGQMAREYKPSDISPYFKPNGTLRPGGTYYARQAAANFVNWRLRIDGMVAHPLSLSVAELRRLPARSQITRHDCVEGWSAIGKWTGVQLGRLLKQVGLQPNARFIVFHCADDFDGTPYYESIDLVDAFHPQTLLAYAMNGEPLSVGHGAPLRLRVERQLGYKQAKYVMRVEAVAVLSGIGDGGGGYWEDAAGYYWYAGV